jgi:hypothetical protein
MDTKRIFWGFCINWFLTLPFGPFRFWLWIRGDIHIQKTTLRSLIRGVADSPYRWYGESPNPHIVESGRLPASLIRGVGDSPYHRYGESAIEFFEKKTLCIDDTESRRLPTPVIRWVADSPYRWVGESPTPHITDTESRRLRVSLSRGVDDSAYIGDMGSRYSKKKIGLALIELFKGLKKMDTLGNLVDSPTHRYGESFFEYEYLQKFEAKIRTARNVV